MRIFPTSGLNICLIPNKEIPLQVGRGVKFVNHLSQIKISNRLSLTRKALHI